MENIYTNLRNSLTEKQIRYLNDLTHHKYYASCNTSYLIEPYYNAPVLNALLLPIWYSNKDKTLSLISHTQYSISGASASAEINAIMNLYNSSSTQHKILLFAIKRGNTFLDSYLQENEWEYLDRISLYLQLSAHHKVKVYQKDNKTFVYTNVDDTIFFQRFMSALPLILKNFFTFTEETQNIYRSMQEDTTGIKTSKLFLQLLEKTNLLKDQKLNELNSALIKLSEYEYTQFKKKEERIANDIASYENSLIRMYKDLKEIQAKATFYQPKLETNDIANYILHNPNIADFAISTDCLILAIEAPLEYYEVPAFKKLVQNSSSFIWPRWSETPEPIARHRTEFIQFLSDLFLKDRYTLYTRSEIIIDFKLKEAYPFKKVGGHRDTYEKNEIRNKYPESWKLENRAKTDKAITPHMHIEFFDCWSGNKANIAKCLQKNDIIGAIDIAVNTTKDINVTDSTVFNRFLQSGLWAPNTRDYDYRYTTRPDLQFKTIYDNEQKKFRTFGDIFYTDYVKENLTQYDISEDFSDII